MKNAKTKNPYATLRGGKINAINKPEGDRKASVIKGGDLRVKGAK